MELEWQLIETAPKDGTVVIVWPPTYNGTVSCAAWDNDRFTKRSRPYWRRLDSRSVLTDRNSQPTHWMPVFTGPER